MNLLDYKFKGVLVSSNDEIIYLNKMNYKNFTFNVCNEVVVTIPIVFYLQKNSYLTEIFNEKIDAFKSAGLIDYWMSKYLDPKYLRVKIEKKGPTQLKFSELLGAFQLLAFGTFCATLTLILEILIESMKIFLNISSVLFRS